MPIHIGALNHFMIAVGCGNNGSLRNAAKDEYMNTSKAYQTYLLEIKSDVGTKLPHSVIVVTNIIDDFPGS